MWLWRTSDRCILHQSQEGKGRAKKETKLPNWGGSWNLALGQAVPKPDAGTWKVSILLWIVLYTWGERGWRSHDGLYRWATDKNRPTCVTSSRSWSAGGILLDWVATGPAGVRSVPWSSMRTGCGQRTGGFDCLGRDLPQLWVGILLRQRQGTMMDRWVPCAVF